MDEQSFVYDKATNMGLFGKLTHSVNKSFSKVAHGSHRAFSKIDHVAHVVSGGVATAAHTVQIASKKGGNALEKVGAAVSIVNPAIGAGLVGLGAGASMLSTGAGMASRGASAFAPDSRGAVMAATKNSRRALTGAANAVKNDVRHSFA
jgi:Na+(H+)/acetate symporter ActP